VFDAILFPFSVYLLISGTASHPFLILAYLISSSIRLLAAIRTRFSTPTDR
jgi:hypothetical protein